MVINLVKKILVFKDWNQLLTNVSRADLQQWESKQEQYPNHEFGRFFSHVHDAMRKERDTWATPSEAAPAPRGDTPASQASHSSLEDQPEMPSRLAIQYFMVPLVQDRSRGTKKKGN